MGNLVWTAITYIATILTVLIIYRVVKADQTAEAAAFTELLMRARKADQDLANRRASQPAKQRFSTARKP